MKLTNNQLLNLQNGVTQLGYLGSLKFTEKVHYALLKNKTKLVNALEPYAETVKKIWTDSGATIVKNNERDEWSYPELSEQEKKEKTDVVIKQIESVLKEESEVDIHKVPFADLYVEENKLPFNLTVLLEPMIDFGE